jgi:hypothetical protein
VEKLWDKALSQALPDRPAKTVFLVPCDSISELPHKIGPTSKYFGLLLVADTRGVDPSLIEGIATQLLEAGLVYMCAWGPECERLHDIFDEADVVRGLDGNASAEPSDDVVMTTWHKDESLKEALQFFVHSAFATESYAKECRDWVIATIGNRNWEEEVRTSIRSAVSEPLAD